MTDAATRLASRLDRLENHLAIVLSVHLFVEYLLESFIDKKSAIAQRILKDHRTYTFSVKLALVFHIVSLPQKLFDNLASLNSLRNAYAHEIDVDLAKVLDKGFVQRDGAPLFGDLAAVRQGIQDDPAAGVRALLQIRDVTFGWLHDVAKQDRVVT